MGYELINIYGPISIQTYGFFITIGVLLFSWLIRRDKRFTQLKLRGKFSEILFVGGLAIFAGGRLLYIIEEPHAFDNYLEWFAFWKEGFSLLGSILGTLIIVPWYLKKFGIPILPFADFVSIYIPLLQAVARLGCFFAGCCYGIAATVFWAVRYIDPNTIAPLNCYLHPTQLYSAGLLFCIFILLYFVLQKLLIKPGQLLTTYLMLASSERFTVDFWRADKTIPFDLLPFSFAQFISLGIFSGAFIGFVYASWRKIATK